MKKLSLALLSWVFILSSCSKDGDLVQDPTFKSKYLSGVVTTNSGVSNTMNMTYTPDGKLSSIIENNGATTFSHNSSGNLTSISSQGDVLDIQELYNGPQEGYEIGRVLSYNAEGNPSKLEIFEDGPGSDVAIADILYDPNPNPYFKTMEAAGIIDVLNNVEVSFNTSNSNILQARLLLPTNNIKTIIAKDFDGRTVYEMQATYVYDADSYPISANITEIVDGDVTTTQVTYSYR